MYRHRGAWKLKLVGAGYEAGLARLCEDYGLSVE
ncbi:TerD family protein [Selenomonas sp. F0473]|nr:TerD family protein [Selenomonas sp. F0473]